MHVRTDETDGGRRHEFLSPSPSPPPKLSLPGSDGKLMGGKESEFSWADVMERERESGLSQPAQPAS